MRITFVVPPDCLSGGLRVIAVYAHQLAQRGHDVTVVQPRHARPTFRQIIRSLRQSHAFPKAPDGGPSFFDDLPVRRVKLTHVGPVTEADVPDADLVIATWWETAEWVWSLPPSKGMKAHFMQDYEIWGGQVERVDATCRLPIPKIVIAKWVSNLLDSRFGQAPIALIPNSVDTKLFHAPRRGKQSTPTVGFTYTPMHNKGTDISIAAINLARQQIPDLKVISFGPMTITTDLPLPTDTEFFFRVPDRELPTLYASCDAWLFGTRVEGFGLPILEAMACRTPVIGTPAGAAPELLAHGGGIPVAMEDPRSMADAILRIARLSPEGWRDLSDAAYATATGYSWEDAADRFESALEQIRTGTPAPHRERIRPSRREAGVP